MDTYVDASYLDYLERDDGKPYMMPVSPWFYSNLPGYNKNWLWRGDDLWRDRCEEVMVVQPDLVQIISWSDFGESHYIGPLPKGDYKAFEVGKAPYDYIAGLAWVAKAAIVVDIVDNAAMGVYDVVKNKGTPAMAVLDLLLGSARVRTGKNYSNAASKRQEMGRRMLASLGMYLSGMMMR
ncbi:Glycoside hydrolase family 71 [Penicillium expansum]|nr:Glycoside hydrolase family 71 [Penicillium expansum]